MSRSSTTTGDTMTGNQLAPIHPGEILMEEFIRPLQVSQSQVARSIGVPPRRINEIVFGKRSISADTALRLARCFNTSPQFWANLQSKYDLDSASDRLGSRLDEVTRLATG